jgi:predicted O-methyltransferase YrrM
MEHGTPTAHDHLLATEVKMDRYIFDCVWDRIFIARNEDGIERTNRNRGYIQQDKEELWQLMEYLIELKPQKILEIGNACGGTALMWQAVAPQVYSLGIIPVEGHIPMDYFPNVKFLVGDSHTQETLDEVKQCGPFDFVFIDGDHCTAGVKQDYEMYSPLIRPGGLVGFHDYNHNPVRTFLIDLPGLTIMPRDQFGIAIKRM